MTELVPISFRTTPVTRRRLRLLAVANDIALGALLERLVAAAEQGAVPGLSSLNGSVR